VWFKSEIYKFNGVVLCVNSIRFTFVYLTCVSQFLKNDKILSNKSRR
jgi:hypothetical protein